MGEEQKPPTDLTPGLPAPEPARDEKNEALRFSQRLSPSGSTQPGASEPVQDHPPWEAPPGNANTPAGQPGLARTPEPSRASQGLIATALELLYGTFFQPVATFGRLGTGRPVGAIILLFALTGILSLVAATSEPGTKLPPVIGGLLSSFLLTTGVIFGLGLWFTMAGILQIIAELFGGQGRGFTLWLGVALAGLPGILYIPLGLVGPHLGPGRAILSIALAIWEVILLIIAVREIHRLSTARAVAVVMLPVGFFIGSLLLMVAFGVALAGSLPLLRGPGLPKWP